MFDLSNESKRRYERIIDDEYRKRFPKQAEAEDQAGCFMFLLLFVSSPFIIYYLGSEKKPHSGEHLGNELVKTDVPAVVTPRAQVIATPTRTAENEAVARLNFDDIGPCAYSVGKSQRLVDQLRWGEYWKDDTKDETVNLNLQMMEEVTYDANYGGLKGLKGTEREVYKKAFRAGYLFERDP